MNFFFDNNLSPRLAKAIGSLEGDHGANVVHLKDKFSQDATDEAWMKALSTEGSWIVITCDRRISKNPHEVRAWKESRLVVFFLKSSWIDLGFWDISWQLIRRWPEIKSFANHSGSGDGFVVPIKGQIATI